MTPKEKAAELVDKFTQTNGNAFFAKECALIAVDEILWEIIKYADNSQQYVIENTKFWQRVKEELQKL